MLNAVVCKEGRTMRITNSIMATLLIVAPAAGCGGDSTSPPGGAPTGTISGSVIDVDSSSAGLSGVSVQLTGSASPQTATTGATGGFTLANVAPGAWQVQVQVPGTHRLEGGEAGTRAVNVTANQTASLTAFRLVRPRGSIEGSVTLDGQGIASGTIAASRAGFAESTATPDASGVFGMTDMAAGPWTLTFAPGPGHALAAGEAGTRSVTVAEGQTTSVSAFQIGAEPPGSGVVDIHLTASSEFDPSSVTIVPGTTVRWINDAAIEHTITPENASQPGVWQRRVTAAAGVVFEHTFNTPNQTYRYRCEPHSSNFETGMVGVITVTGS
jgi:plastocyanin